MLSILNPRDNGLHCRFMKKYDVIVIGSGGGAKITSPAARLGLKVACIEKDAFGGTCLNRGCIPSKMLIHPADVAMEIKGAKKFSINNNPLFHVDFENLITRISNTVDQDSASIVEGYRRNPNIDLYPAEAKFISNKVIRVAEQEITADKIFITIGARPYILPTPGLAATPFMTSAEALRNKTLPKKMIIIGGGYIAVELGHAYGALGTQVHFLVRTQFLRHEDSQVAKEFTRIFSKNHTVHFGALPTRVDYQDGSFTVSYKNLIDAPSQVTADALLIAAGVVPNTDTLDLGNTDIAVDEKGFVKVNDQLQTSVDGIYAFGDCIGRYCYRHTANFEGEYLFQTVFGDHAKKPIRYPPVPHAVFTHPQVDGVGKTEDQLKNEKVDYVVGLNPYQSSAMGMALLSDGGFVKILLDRHSRKILGAHIVGDEASNMIHLLIAFMNKDGTLDDLLNMIYIHPALPEIVRNAARKAATELKEQGHKSPSHTSQVKA